MLTFDCFTTREIMREREGIEESNMKIIDRFSYSDGGTKVKSYFSEEQVEYFPTQEQIRSAVKTKGAFQNDNTGNVQHA